jgi:hypothetical protein
MIYFLDLNKLEKVNLGHRGDIFLNTNFHNLS